MPLATRAPTIISQLEAAPKTPGYKKISAISLDLK